MGLSSPLDPYEIYRRWRYAQIPDWTQPYMADGDTTARDLVAKSRPANVVAGWEKAMVEGLIVGTSSLALRGRGLWLVGGRDATVLATTLLQRLLLMGYVESGRFLTEPDLLASEGPDGERLPVPRLVPLLVLADVGTAYRAASGWADAVVSSLLHDRSSAGLPTLVVSEKSPFECGLSRIFVEDAFYVVIFKDPA